MCMCTFDFNLDNFQIEVYTKIVYYTEILKDVPKGG